MTGTLINALAIVFGGLLGLMAKRRIPEKYHRLYFQAVGLFVLALGAKMAIEMREPLFAVSSLVLGAMLGGWWKIADRADAAGKKLQKWIKTSNEQFSEGLITAFLLFCIGSMTILGAVEEGLGQAPTLLLTKSLMDFFSAMLLAATLGSGVIFSAIPLLIFQGGITLLVSFFGDIIPQEVIRELNAVGGILLVGLAINILEIKKIQLLNFLPALLLIVVAMYVRIWMVSL